MDFKDWRKSAQPQEGKTAPARPLRVRNFSDHIEAQIQEARERGAFDNLQGSGKPLLIDSNPYAGDRALGYSLLKNSGHLPPELELAREIRQKREQLDRQCAELIRRGQDLRRRRVRPSASEKRVYNNAVGKTLASYEADLKELNRKILTLNLTTPSAMHQPALEVETLVSQFREACPPFV